MPYLENANRDPNTSVDPTGKSSVGVGQVANAGQSAMTLADILSGKRDIKDPHTVVSGAQAANNLYKGSQALSGSAPTGMAGGQYLGSAGSILTLADALSGKQEFTPQTAIADAQAVNQLYGAYQAATAGSAAGAGAAGASSAGTGAASGAAGAGAAGAGTGMAGFAAGLGYIAPAFAAMMAYDEHQSAKDIKARFEGGKRTYDRLIGAGVDPRSLDYGKVTNVITPTLDSSMNPDTMRQQNYVEGGVGPTFEQNLAAKYAPRAETNTAYLAQLLRDNPNAAKVTDMHDLTGAFMGNYDQQGYGKAPKTQEEILAKQKYDEWAKPLLAAEQLRQEDQNRSAGA